MPNSSHIWNHTNSKSQIVIKQILKNATQILIHCHLTYFHLKFSSHKFFPNSYHTNYHHTNYLHSNYHHSNFVKWTNNLITYSHKWITTCHISNCHHTYSKSHKSQPKNSYHRARQSSSPSTQLQNDRSVRRRVTSALCDAPLNDEQKQEDQLELRKQEQ